jgi:hypothetical protein
MLHKLNILLHIIFGSAALIAGGIALLSAKGGTKHRKAGKLFAIFLSVVITTGLIGIFFFNTNIFLLVITMISFYQGYSGYRVLQHKEKGPTAVDAMVTVATVMAAAYFIYYINSTTFIWSATVVYSTLGWLGVVTLYDFFRFAISRQRYASVWIYEHIVKMTGAFTAILSAFIGTVLPISFQPWSQLLPSVFGTLIILAFCRWWGQQPKRILDS